MSTATLEGGPDAPAPTVPSFTVTLIIRRFDQDGKYAEEKILRIPHGHDVDAESLSQALMNYSAKAPAKKKAGRSKAKRRLPPEKSSK